ncbi:MAG: type II secretion system protein J [Thermoanaerobaculia bacterium]
MPARGYSLAEVVVSLTIFIAILVGVLFIFNLNYRLARNRSDTSERLAALRSARHDMVRLARMAGRGGLPRELAIIIDDNVAPGTRVGGPDSPAVVAGTDLLTVRGVFATPLFRVGPADGSLQLGTSGEPATGVVEIRDPSPQTGVAQSLAELAAMLEAGRPAPSALLLVSQLDEAIFAVVESAVEDAQIEREGDRVTGISLEFDTAGAPPALAGSGPVAALRGAAFVGILEEYRFYVRAAFSAPGDDTSNPRTQLSVARFVPGTDRPWGGTDGSLAVDMADDVSDLQVTLAVDSDGDSRLVVELVSG